MKGVNKAFILGHLGNDPEAITFQDGNMITNLSIATSEVWTDRNGQRQESTQWHRIRLNGKLAELGMRMLAKGSQVYIEGSLKTRKWMDKNNQPQYVTEVHAEKMEILTFLKPFNDNSLASNQPQNAVGQQTQNLPVWGDQANQVNQLNKSMVTNTHQQPQSSTVNNTNNDTYPDIPF
ncbi:hypothetical protein A9Z61_11225 [Moraxella osloensis]|nr:single-stranded DNA-binding protein [Moraxella osloensis]OBX56719.1 hypothetical protein A9Z61_11225 [Moraxella osloensis]